MVCTITQHEIIETFKLFFPRNGISKKIYTHPYSPSVALHLADGTKKVRLFDLKIAEKRQIQYRPPQLASKLAYFT